MYSLRLLVLSLSNVSCPCHFCMPFKLTVHLFPDFYPFQTGFKGMRSSVSSSGNDLGLWYSKRDGCWSCFSIHLHHPQLTPGNESTVSFSCFLHITDKTEISGSLWMIDQSTSIARHLKHLLTFSARSCKTTCKPCLYSALFFEGFQFKGCPSFISPQNETFWRLLYVFNYVKACIVRLL